MANLAFITKTFTSYDWGDTLLSVSPDGKLYLNGGSPAYPGGHYTVKFSRPIKSDGFSVGIQEYRMTWDTNNNMTRDRVSNIGFGIEELHYEDDLTLSMLPYVQLYNGSGRYPNFRTAILTVNIVAQYKDA